MLYNLLNPYIHTSHIANLFHYITFRSGLAIILSLLISFIIGPKIINHFSGIHKNGKTVREDVPDSHQKKVGTPTMGGIIIISSILVPTLLLADLSNPYILVACFVLFSLGVVGFIDDYMKLTRNNSKGVSGKAKLLAQFSIALIACTVIYIVTKPEAQSILTFPFFKNLIIDLGLFYIPFSVFVLIGSSNAVNLTDGLDGLAIVPIAIVAGSFGIISYLVGNSVYSNYLQIVYIQNAGELAVFCFSVVGAGLGFLWFNAQPAQIFMGDTGSLSLGGALGMVSVITKHEIALSIIGGLFVIETMSVIIQVYYFKATGGKRFFKMAPLHHHFEKSGWPESRVVIRFWIVAMIFALIGLSSLKLR